MQFANQAIAKKTRGRQKIKMVKIDDERNVQVTFSKRRTGLFKKASELSTLCDAGIAVIIFSPGNKAYSFGNPTVEAVLDRFLNGTGPNSQQFAPGMLQAMGMYRNAEVSERNAKLVWLLGQIEAEKKCSKEIKQTMMVTQMQCCWKRPVEELSLPELVQLKASLEELKKSVTARVELILAQAEKTPPYFAEPSSTTMVPSKPLIIPCAVNNINAGGFNNGGSNGTGFSDVMIPNVPCHYPYEPAGFY